MLLCCHGCAGKTYLAQRLAQQYSLLHVNTAAVLSELPLMDAETQKVGGLPLLLT
jgi:adenylate kinase family enzyme